MNMEGMTAIECLRELVALKRIKEKMLEIELNGYRDHDTQSLLFDDRERLTTLSKEYERRKPLAWAAARAIVENAAAQEPVRPAAASIEPTPVAAAPIDSIVVTQADVDRARTIVLDCMGLDVLSGDRPAKKEDRTHVYRQLGIVQGLLVGSVAAAPTGASAPVAGEEWFFMRLGASACDKGVVERLTAATVTFRGGPSWADRGETLPRTDVRFVERIDPPAAVPSIPSETKL